MRKDIPSQIFARDTRKNGEQPINALPKKNKVEIAERALSILTGTEFLYYTELLQGKSQKDIAIDYGVNRSTVCRAIQRAKRKIRWYVDNIYIAKIEIE